ncbi:NepR family anti-sigma factor [Blastomonas aquatica]|uniref:Anti-sigma factor NepR domain-containing protein n=1 Tax=Blastomonas aquatica TaxID=1510276 RepID=A0ABQ1IQN5_9SPHN|nr:NepR family anti-sigma factor [Blastomonas aquatica]GGB50219.1 hypothetical protein GCM10010833_01070 [Blastomonas aquatica]
MLVHRNNDEKPSEDQPAQPGRPHVIAESPLADESDTAPDSHVDDATRDDGKTHMIGDALKSVYQRTLEEDVPDDFLDLLKQLK